MHKNKPLNDQNVKITIQSLGLNGEGIGYLNGHKLFVEGALPGEVVQGRISECKKRFSRLNIENISELSPDRVEAPCRYFGVCGGCQLMHLHYGKQLTFKQQRVNDALLKSGNLEEVMVEACEPSPRPLHYRNKILLPVRENAGGFTIGLYARNSHELIDIDKCLVHCELGEDVFHFVSNIVRNSTITPYDHSTGKGVLRFIQIKTAESSGQVLITFIVKQNIQSQLTPIAQEILENCPSVKGVVMNIHTEPGNTALGPDFETILGQGYIEEFVLGKKFKVSPASFFQVNLQQAERIYKKALELANLQGNEVLLDAFCGVGTLTLCAAPYVKHAIGVECVQEAINDAKINGSLNQTSNVSFVCDNAEHHISHLEKVDVAFLNPPRKGCDAVFLKHLARLNPQKIIYISCDPTTLARDLEIMKSYGYHIGTVYPFDMFPQTAHVESVVKLQWM